MKQVLETYGITQNRLAVAMGIDRSNVSRWVNETRDPSAEAVAEIKDALEKLDPAAAEDFVMLFLYKTFDTPDAANVHSNKADSGEPAGAEDSPKEARQDGDGFVAAPLQPIKPQMMEGIEPRPETLPQTD